MDNLKQRVLESLKWKKHPSISSARLGISEEKYRKIKNELLAERKNKKTKKLDTDTQEG